MSRANTFRLQARYVLLTYSQSGDLDGARVASHLESLGGKSVIGRENHADGGIHLHAFVDFGHQFSTRDVHIFDVDDRHPNVQRGYRTPEKMWDYATKDGDVVHEGLDRPGRNSRMGSTASHDRWQDIISAPTRGEFFERIAQSDPRTLCVSFVSITKYADEKYKPVDVPYVTQPGLEWDGWALTDGQEWVQRNVLEFESGVRYVLPLAGQTGHMRLP